jgi:hypothetical protein
MRRPIVAMFHRVGNIWLLVRASCGALSRQQQEITETGRVKKTWGAANRAQATA